MKQTKSRQHSQRGSILFTVLVILAMVAILATAALTITAVSHRTVVTNYEQEQAHYTAKSALDGIVSYLKAPPANDKLLEELKKLPDEGFKQSAAKSVDGMGEYTVTITKKKGGNLFIKAEGTYLGEKESVSAVLEAGAESGGVFDGFFTATGLDGRDTKSLNNGGVLSINGDSHFHNSDSSSLIIGGSNSIGGSLTNTGNIQITGGAIIKPGTVIISNKSINVSSTTGGDNICGILVAKNNVELKGAGEIKTQAIYVGGNMSIANIAKVNGDIYVNGDFTVTDCILTGNVYVNGRINATRTTFLGSQTNNSTAWDKSTPYDNIDVTSNSYTKWVLPESEFSNNSYDIKLGTGTGYKLESIISESGTFHSYQVQEWQHEGGYSLIINASAKDIYLKIPKGCSSGGNNFRLGNEVKLKILGDHNVFLCLEDGSGWDAQYNYSDVGARVDGRAFDDAHPPQLFLISNDTSKNVTIDLANGNNVFYGYVYIPMGIFKCNDIVKDRLIGGVVAGSFEITNGKFSYIKPPEDVIKSGLNGGAPIGGGSSPSSSPYTVISYGNGTEQP